MQFDFFIKVNATTKEFFQCESNLCPRMCSSVLLILQIFLVAYVSSSGCGVRRNDRQHMITGGSVARPGDWPWHIALYHRKNRQFDYACGGTLINEKFVLTSAHCMFEAARHKPLTSDKLLVRLGVHELSELGLETVQNRTVRSIIIHESYDKNKHDIALLQLSERVVFTDSVVAACLNNVADLTNQNGTAIGWGYTEIDKLSTVLRQGNMPVVDIYECLDNEWDLFRGKLHRGLLCAGYRNGTQVCNGDSGGGLFFRRDGVWYLGAITSFSSMRDISGLCSTKGYAAFTDVAKYLPWVANKTGIDFGKTRHKPNEERCLRAGRVQGPSNRTLAYGVMVRNAPGSRDDDAPLLELAPKFDKHERVDLSCLRKTHTLHREDDDRIVWRHSYGWFASLEDRRTCNTNAMNDKDLTIILPGASFWYVVGSRICDVEAFRRLIPQMDFIEMSIWMPRD